MERQLEGLKEEKEFMEGEIVKIGQELFEQR